MFRILKGEDRDEEQRKSAGCWQKRRFMMRAAGLPLLLALGGAPPAVGLPVLSSSPPAVPAGFDSAQLGLRVNGSQIALNPASVSAEKCATACLAQGPGCIAFNWIGNKACELSGWSPNYTVYPCEGSVYYTRTLPRNDTAVTQQVSFLLDVPTGGVELTGGPFLTAFATNLLYLGQFPVDDMLYWFRQRAGAPNSDDATSWVSAQAIPQPPLFLMPVITRN